MEASTGLKKVFEEQKIAMLEGKYQKLVSKILSQGGVLKNEHIHFDEETFEQVNEDNDVSSFKTQQKRKWKEVKEEKLEGEDLTKNSKKKEISFSKAYKKCRLRKKAFPYGNEVGYYDKRIGCNGVDDPRLPLFQEEWFNNKDVLDVGCHEGYITITLAQMYTVTSMHGVDIDEKLITKAYEHLNQEATSSYHTLSLETCENVTYESNSPDDVKFYDAFSEFEQDKDYDLLQRVSFETTNFLEYEIEDCCVDTILCLSVTKWVHLNWGDEGLKSLFQKIFRALRPGGVFILEPQGWKSYRKNRQTTKTIHENYLKLTLRPDDFTSILINQVGFNSCKLIARTIQGTEKGFDRPMYCYTK